MKRFILILCVLFFCLTSTVKAQYARAEAKLQSDTVALGKLFTLDVAIILPDKQTQVEWPLFGDTLSRHIDINKISDIDTNGMTLSRTLTLQAFAEGETEIPSLTFHYGRDSILEKTASTRSLPLFVNNIAVDTTRNFRPIRLPKSQHITGTEISYIIAGLIVVAGLVFLVIRLSKLKRKPKIVEKKKIHVAPKVPAIITARLKFDTIRKEEQWSRHDIKEYHTELTDIIREYLDGEFFIDAVEMTTDEILAAVAMAGIPEKDIYSLRQMLSNADLVKFAKANMSLEANRQAFDDAVAFVEQSHSWNEAEKQRKAEEEKLRKEKK